MQIWSNFTQFIKEMPLYSNLAILIALWRTVNRNFLGIVATPCDQEILPNSTTISFNRGIFTILFSFHEIFREKDWSELWLLRRKHWKKLRLISAKNIEFMFSLTINRFNFKVVQIPFSFPEWAKSCVSFSFILVTCIIEQRGKTYQ